MDILFLPVSQNFEILNFPTKATVLQSLKDKVLMCKQEQYIHNML